MASRSSLQHKNTAAIFAVLKRRGELNFSMTVEEPKRIVSTKI